MFSVITSTAGRKLRVNTPKLLDEFPSQSPASRSCNWFKPVRGILLPHLQKKKKNPFTAAVQNATQ